MAEQEADVLRIAAPDAEILDGTQPVKLRQVALGTTLNRLYWKRPSDGEFVPFLNGSELGSQDSAFPGAILLGMSGLAGVTPTGGTVGAAATIKAMLEGLLEYINSSITPVPGMAQVFEYLGVFPWAADNAYSQNEFCYIVSGDFVNPQMYVSNIPGEGTNTGNDPTAGGAWTNTTFARMLTYILNNKADKT